MNKTRNYVREEAFWITGAKNKIYTDLYLPIENLEFYVKGNKVSCSQMNGVFLNNKPIQSEIFVISKGDALQFLGYTLTFYETQVELTGNLDASTSKLLETERETEAFPNYPYYKRSPRIVYQLKKEKIEIKAPPAKPNLTKRGIFQVMLPALTTATFTVVMGYFLGRGPMIYMGVGMTIIMLIFNTNKFLQNRKEKKLEIKQRQDVYEEYVLGIRKKILKKRREEREALNYQNPTPQAIEHMILQEVSSRLYERTVLDADFLQVNLGYYQGKSSVEISFSKDELSIDKDELIEMAKEITKEHGQINQIPVTIDLKKAHLGLVGSEVNIHKYLKFLLLQLTFFQSYHDVQFIFLYHEDYRDTFSYTRWYPHLKIQGLNVNGGIYNDNARDQILGSIHQILKERKQKLEEEKQEQSRASRRSTWSGINQKRSS